MKIVPKETLLPASVPPDETIDNVLICCYLTRKILESKNLEPGLLPAIEELIRRKDIEVNDEDG